MLLENKQVTNIYARTNKTYNNKVKSYIARNKKESIILQEGKHKSIFLTLMFAVDWSGSGKLPSAVNFL